MPPRAKTPAAAHGFIEVDGARHHNLRDLAAAVPLLVDLGVPREAIAVDDKSRNTYENSRFTERLLLERVLAAGKPTVVILLAGSAIDLSAAQEKATTQKAESRVPYAVFMSLILPEKRAVANRADQKKGTDTGNTSTAPLERTTRISSCRYSTDLTVPVGSITATNGRVHASPRWRTTRHGVRESRVMP